MSVASFRNSVPTTQGRLPESKGESSTTSQQANFPGVASSEGHMCLRQNEGSALTAPARTTRPPASRALASGCCTTDRSHQSHCSTRSLHRRRQSDPSSDSGAAAPSDTWLSRKMSSCTEALVATKHALGRISLPVKTNGVCVKILAQASMTSAHRKNSCDPELRTVCKQSGRIQHLQCSQSHQLRIRS